MSMEEISCDGEAEIALHGAKAHNVKNILGTTRKIRIPTMSLFYAGKGPNLISKLVA